ncbi:MAG: hypothetical protein KDD40_05925 [Bdellovibrionales bacterium]|nr:hypothetical protein [Bdellovibrionales bacterium]
MTWYTYKTLILVFVSSTLIFNQSAIASQAESLACQKKQAFYNFHKKYNEPIEKLVNKIFAEPSQLIIFGEEHSIHDEEFWSYLSPILISKNSGVDCVFVEKGKGTDEEKALNSFQSGNASALNGFKSTRRFMRWDNSMNSFSHFVQKLNSHGIRLINVDDDSKQGGDILENLNGRDASMAKNILLTYSLGQCTRGIYLVGIMHMLRSDAGRGRVTLVNHLEEAGLDVKLVLVNVAGQLGVYDKDGPTFPNQGKLGDTYIWQKSQNSIDEVNFLCRENSVIPEEPFGFVVDKKDAPKSPLLYFPLIENCIFGPSNCLESKEHDSFFGNYNDVDFVWVHRCMGKKSCNRVNEEFNQRIRDKSDEIY